MDIVESVERIFGVDLLEPQKHFLRDLDARYPRSGPRFIWSRRAGVYIYLDPKTQKELIQHGQTSNSHN